MSSRKVNLDYLSPDEVEQFYELFFGKILIKKPGFSYQTNLAASLKKESFIISILDKLKPFERDVLDLLSSNLQLHYPWLHEKLAVILDEPTTAVNKAMATLITRNYVFLRDNKELIIPDIYFDRDPLSVKITPGSSKFDGEPYRARFQTDVNNLINFFISNELKFSNTRVLYKKDLSLTEKKFKKYSGLTSQEINAVAYFYATAFCDESGTLVLEELESYFHMTPLEQTLYFVQLTMPASYSMLLHCHSWERTTAMNMENFENFWVQSMLKTPSEHVPVALDFSERLALLSKSGLVIVDGDQVTIPLYARQEPDFSNELRVSSNYTLYMNSDAVIHDFYLIALFADLVKYNKIVEYEINEKSIQRGIHNGITMETINEFISRFELSFSGNVQSTLQQWFDKYGSMYYVTGTLFVCQTPTRGKLIKTLIEKGVVKGIEVKGNELFLIQETDTEAFFDFLKKSDIYFFKKEPASTRSVAGDLKIPNLADLLDYVDDQAS
jgi:hypothetical protein